MFFISKQEGKAKEIRQKAETYRNLNRQKQNTSNLHKVSKSSLEKEVPLQRFLGREAEDCFFISKKEIKAKENKAEA